MTEGIAFLSVPLPSFSDREIMRYAGVGGPVCESGISELLIRAKDISRGALDENIGIIYREADINISGNACDFGFARVSSASLSKALSGAHRVLFMCTTLGVKFDALIMKYMRISPSLAHMISSVGSERVEAAADSFCRIIGERNISSGEILTPRFSPGYSDLPIECQRDIFLLLDCPIKIGLTLTESMLMSPSKSVSAIIGIK